MNFKEKANMQLIKVSHQKISASSLIGPAILQGRICSCQTIIHVLLMRAGPMISLTASSGYDFSFPSHFIETVGIY